MVPKQQPSVSSKSWARTGHVLPIRATQEIQLPGPSRELNRVTNQKPKLIGITALANDVFHSVMSLDDQSLFFLRAEPRASHGQTVPV